LLVANGIMIRGVSRRVCHCHHVLN